MLNRSITLCALSVTFTLCAASANAADVYSAPGYKDTSVYAPLNTWTGFYFGVNTGALWNGNTDKVDVTAYHYAGDPGSASGGSDTIGGFGGGQIGYNLHSGKLVFGVEADLQGALAHDKATTGPAASAWEGEEIEHFTVGVATSKSELDWFGTVRGRLGVLLQPNTLVYATGGFAFGGVRDQLSDYSVNQRYEGGTQSVTSSKTLTGYTIGGGVEYAISPVWSIKAEYQYLDLGSTSLGVSAFSTGYDYTNGTVKVDHQYHTVRLGINYHVAPVYEPLK